MNFQIIARDGAKYVIHVSVRGEQARPSQAEPLFIHIIRLPLNLSRLKVYGSILKISKTRECVCYCCCLEMRQFIFKACA